MSVTYVRIHVYIPKTQDLCRRWSPTCLFFSSVGTLSE